MIATTTRLLFQKQIRMTQSIFNSFSTGSRVNYYEVLGVQPTASEQAIKEAYYSLARKYHPDVRTTSEFSQSAGQQFRAISQAYAVLSVLESRQAYDAVNKTHPNIVYGQYRSDLYNSSNVRARDGTPLSRKASSTPSAGSYHEEKLQILREQRQLFNVDDFDRHRGGLPQKGKGKIRGNALGQPGTFHSPYLHNRVVDPFPDSQNIGRTEAQAFQNYKSLDRNRLQKRGTWFTAEVNYDYFRFQDYMYGFRLFRNFFLAIVALPTAIYLWRQRELRAILDDFQQFRQQNPQSSTLQVSNRDVVVQSNGVVRFAN